MKQPKIFYSTKIITTLITKWLRSSVDEGLRILIWVIMWSLLETYVNMLNGAEKGLIIVALLILLQKDVLRCLQRQKRPGRKPRTQEEKVIEQIKKADNNL